MYLMIYKCCGENKMANYDSYGRSPDKTRILAIGLPSASKDSASGWTETQFKNECPKCHEKQSLTWGIFYGGSFNGRSEGGSEEGHIFCESCDADYSVQGWEHITGSTDRCIVTQQTKPSSKERAEQLKNGQLPYDGSTDVGDASGGSVVGGTAVQIPDVTFYGLIKQIIGGIDGVFIIANNLAYLLSFKDVYKYRDKFDEYIPIIQSSDIIENSLLKNWTTSGFYNCVELTYKDGTIRYQYDNFVKQYGENTFYYEFPDDDEETAKAKAHALLSAHVRDYSTDIELSILYNENITEGSWVKLHKNVTKLSGKNRKEREQEKLELKGQTILKKRKGINITNMTEELVKQEDNTYKKIQHIIDENGEETDIELENSEYDLFFVQGFTCRWDKKHSLIMDLHLKYGPDTPEDPINATIGVGQVSTESGNTSGNGSWGDDCFSICDICTEDCKAILGAGSGRRKDAEEYIRQHEPNSEYLSGRAKQDSSYAKEVAGKTAAEAYTLFRDKFNYACYSDSCDGAYPCCADLWDKATAANCGDSTRMLKVLMDAVGTPCYGIHVNGHYFNAVQVDGTWHTLDGTRGPTNSSCNFPDSGNYGAGSNECGSGWC